MKSLKKYIRRFLEWDKTHSQFHNTDFVLSKKKCRIEKIEKVLVISNLPFQQTNFTTDKNRDNLHDAFIETGAQSTVIGLRKAKAY